MEFYELRFSGNPARWMRLWVSLRTAFIAMPAWTGITLLAAAKLLEATVGLDTTQTMLLVVPISFAYVFLSGYRGVVISNFVQMTVFLSGAVVLLLLTMAHFGGPQGVRAVLSSMLGRSGELLAIVPPSDHAIFPLAAALGWMVGQTLGYGGDTAPMSGAMEGQRILSSRDPRQASYMYVVTAVTMFTLLLLVSLPCVLAPALWPELLKPEGDRELAYGLLMKTMLPAGALGLVAAAMLAGVMSTVGDNLNFGSQVLLNDIYRRWIVRGASERHYLVAGKAGMFVIVTLALVVVYKTRFIYDVAVFMLQLSAAELPANWAQWWWWRFNGKARLAASFGGGAIFCLVVPLPKMLIWLGFGWASVAIIPWWYQTLLVMALTTVLWVTVAFATKPESVEVLDDFYRRAKPLGRWEPVAKRVSGATNEKGASRRMLIPSGFLIALIGTAGVSFYILGLSSLFVGWTAKGVLELAAGVFLFIGFARWLTRFLGKLETRSGAGLQ
jgi:Na+/proline symporter